MSMCDENGCDLEIKMMWSWNKHWSLTCSWPPSQTWMLPLNQTSTIGSLITVGRFPLIPFSTIQSSLQESWGQPLCLSWAGQAPSSPPGLSVLCVWVAWSGGGQWFRSGVRGSTLEDRNFLLPRIPRLAPSIWSIPVEQFFFTQDAPPSGNSWSVEQNLSTITWWPQKQVVFIVTKLKLVDRVLGLPAKFYSLAKSLFVFVKSSSSRGSGEVWKWNRSWSAGDCCWRQPEPRAGGGGRWLAWPPLATWQRATLAKHRSHRTPFPSFWWVCISRSKNCMRKQWQHKKSASIDWLADPLSCLWIHNNKYPAFEPLSSYSYSKKELGFL